MLLSMIDWLIDKLLIYINPWEAINDIAISLSYQPSRSNWQLSLTTSYRPPSHAHSTPRCVLLWWVPLLYWAGMRCGVVRIDIFMPWCVVFSIYFVPWCFALCCVISCVRDTGIMNCVMRCTFLVLICAVLCCVISQQSAMMCCGVK